MYLVALQGTHCQVEEQQKRGKILGYELLGATCHRSHGVATSVKQNIENAFFVFTSTEDTNRQL